MEGLLAAYGYIVQAAERLHRNLPAGMKECPKLILESVLMIILATIILLPNILVTSNLNIIDFYTDQAPTYNYAFASIENETNSSTSSTSSNLDSSPGSLESNARYFCGTIVGEDGPLRPGRYNSDINIFNRQLYPVSFFWNAIPSSTPQSSKVADGSALDSSSSTANTNYRLQALQPGESISLSCKDFVPSFLLYSNTTDGVDRFIEGVSTISVDLDPSIQAVIGSSGVVISQPTGEATNEPNTNILSVDAIYTVNALEVPSREIVLQLVEYSINKQDINGKLPTEIILKPLSITVPIRTNETVNPDTQVRDILAREYSLNATERQSLDITIRNLSLGVGALDDNHAISLQRINAYQPAPPSATPPPSVSNSTSP